MASTYVAHIYIHICTGTKKKEKKGGEEEKEKEKGEEEKTHDIPITYPPHCDHVVLAVSLSLCKAHSAAVRLSHSKAQQAYINLSLREAQQADISPSITQQGPASSWGLT